MLRDPLTLKCDSYSSLVFSAVGMPTPKATRIQCGMYQIGHFNFGHLLVGDQVHWSNEVREDQTCWVMYPSLSQHDELIRRLGERGLDVIDQGEDLPQFQSYGVCDSPEQFLEHNLGKYLVASDRNFVISFSCIRKADEDEYGGWRWHKWGPYIGNKNPKHEYIYDEDDDIQEVYCYQVFEAMDELLLK